jgi:hypothetical protein
VGYDQYRPRGAPIHSRLKGELKPRVVSCEGRSKLSLVEEGRQVYRPR